MLKTSWRKSDTDAWLKGRSVSDDDGATLFMLSRGGVGGGTGGGGGMLILSVPEIVDNLSRLKWAAFIFFFF